MKRERGQSLDKSQKQFEIKNLKKGKGNEKINKSRGNFQMYDLKLQKQLDRQFFRQEVVTLAQQLLGKVILCIKPQGVIRVVIVETQAYKAPADKACHAYNNKKTQRTKYFWLDGGHLYLYTIYMPTNLCLNVVAGLQGQPQAVLIRAVQPIEGLQLIKQYRNINSKKVEDLCNGPAKIGMSLKIDKETMNGIDLTKGDIRIVDGGFKEFQMGVSKRINIDYAEEWIDKPWRFYIEGNSFVSNPPKVQKEKKGKAKDE